jgi:hypothetical protein
MGEYLNLLQSTDKWRSVLLVHKTGYANLRKANKMKPEYVNLIGDQEQNNEHKESKIKTQNGKLKRWQTYTPTKRT